MIVAKKDCKEITRIHKQVAVTVGSARLCVLECWATSFQLYFSICCFLTLLQGFLFGGGMCVLVGAEFVWYILFFV